MLDAAEENELEKTIKVFLKGSELIMEEDWIDHEACILGEFSVT